MLLQWVNFVVHNYLFFYLLFLFLEAAKVNICTVVAVNACLLLQTFFFVFCKNLPTNDNRSTKVRYKFISHFLSFLTVYFV